MVKEKEMEEREIWVIACWLLQDAESLVGLIGVTHKVPSVVCCRGQDLTFDLSYSPHTAPDVGITDQLTA